MTIEDTTAFRDAHALNVYDFVTHTYNGTDGYRDGSYLIPHPREAFYNTRRRSSYYVNAFRPVVDAMVNPVFKGEIARTSNSDAMDGFIANADNAGTPLQQYSRSAMLHARLHGICFVVMDNVTTEELKGAPTEAQAIAYRAYPYIYLKTAQCMKCIDVDKYGRMMSVTLYDGVRKDGARDVPQYRYWDSQKWQLIEYKMGDGKEIPIVVSEGTHGLGVVPVIPVNPFLASQSLAVMPQPPLFDLAFLSFALYNKESLVVTMEQNQSFSILYVSGMNAANLTVGPTNALFLGDGAKFAPGFVSPDAQHINNLVKNCDRIEERIHSLAQQNGVIGVVSQTSGVSKEWDFRAEEGVLQETALAASNLEYAIADLFDLYRESVSGYEVTYPKQFTPSYSKDRVDQALRILDSIPPDAIKSAAWDEVASEFWKGEPDVLEEIEAAEELAGENEAQSRAEDNVPPVDGDMGGDMVTGATVDSREAT